MTRGDIDLAKDFCLEFGGVGHYNAICRPADELLRIVADIKDYDCFEAEQLLKQIKKTAEGRAAAKMCGYHADAMCCIKRILESDVLYPDEESDSSSDSEEDDLLYPDSSSDSEEDDVHDPASEAQQEVRRSPRIKPSSDDDSGEDENNSVSESQELRRS